MEECADDTIFGNVVAIPLKIKISIGELSIFFVSGVPSYYGITKVSRNGIEPSVPVSSTVNLMLGSTELM